jgi:hypothetical protein
MFNVRRRTGFLIVVAASMAISLPVLNGQTPAGGGGGRGNVPQGDYNVSTRSAADKALPSPYARNETFFKFPKGRTLGSTSGI